VGAVSDLLVLCYHAISPDWPADLSTTPERFESQLKRLKARGYRGVTFSEAVAHGGRGGKAVAVTFDDAYRSVLELARPILDRLGMPGTVFAPTAWIGRDEPMSWPGIDQWLGGPHEQELLPMDWDQLRELRAGGWEIGSHTVSHPHLTQIGDRELEVELRDSRRDCEDGLGAPCPAIAYPYGDVDERVVEATRAAGYSAAGALPPRWHAERPLEWPRVGVYYGDDERRFALKASPLVRRVRARFKLR
jgi:peptidoglycan/xylan/chitin deacetylase (PgdA/CDA1 family)